MRVLFRFDASGALERRVTALSGDGIDVQCCPESDDAGFEALLPGIDVLWHVLKPVTAGQIKAAKKLKLIQKIGSGVNTIDVEAARARDIAVCNLPGVNSRAVAEMTLLLMLACLRRLPELDSMVRGDRWQDAGALQDRLGELHGRAVGLIGYGAVPRLLAPMLHLMGAKVRYWSRSEKNAELDALLARSDIVSLHLPLTPQTANFLDPRKMKRRSILINTARGGLVDEALLVQCLKDGHLAALGTDVFAEEPARAGHPLFAFHNVVCAPHVAWLTRETLERALVAAMDNARRLRAGEALLNRVD